MKHIYAVCTEAVTPVCVFEIQHEAVAFARERNEAYAGDVRRRAQELRELAPTADPVFVEYYTTLAREQEEMAAAHESGDPTDGDLHYFLETWPVCEPGEDPKAAML